MQYYEVFGKRFVTVVTEAEINLDFTSEERVFFMQFTIQTALFDPPMGLRIYILAFFITRSALNRLIMRNLTLPFLFSFLILVSAQAQIINIPGDYASIQEGINHAEEGDTVLVAPGLYLENIQFIGKDIILTSHYLLSQDEEMIEQTIIDGALLNPVITLKNEETSEAAIIGFTLIGGSNLEEIQSIGGGIVCYNASPTIWKNKIMACTNRNFSDYDFGGIHCINSSAVIMENHIDSIGGFFVRKVGGIVSHRSDLTIENNWIGRIVGGYSYRGAGISADSSILRIHHNLVDSCSFDAPPYSASIKLSASTAEITQNTLLGEIGLFKENEVLLRNNIILSPTENIAIEEQQGSSQINCSYNLIQGNWTGTGNIDVDPMFVDISIRDYHLRENSPCIDSGDPESLTDPDGTRADIGVFYFHQNVSSSHEEGFARAFSIHPNPTTDFINIESESFTKALYFIYSENGQLLEQNASALPGKVSVQTLKSGVYFVKVKIKGEGEAVFKFVKR